MEETLTNSLEMFHLGVTTSYIGIKFLYLPKGIIFLQYHYATIILHCFNMSNCHPSITPMNEEIQLYVNM
jgi:hypothetical protein